MFVSRKDLVLVAFWLLANLFDTLITLVGFSRGFPELNPLMASLGVPAMFVLKWVVVVALVLAIPVVASRLRLRGFLIRAMRILTGIVWAVVGWNLAVLRWGGG